MKRLRSHENEIRFTRRGYWVLATIWTLLFVGVCYLESLGT